MVSDARQVARNTAGSGLSDCVECALFIDRYFGRYDARQGRYECVAIVAFAASAQLLVECLFFRIALTSYGSARNTCTRCCGICLYRLCCKSSSGSGVVIRSIYAVVDFRNLSQWVYLHK